MPAHHSILLVASAAFVLPVMLAACSENESVEMTEAVTTADVAIPPSAPRAMTEEALAEEAMADEAMAEGTPSGESESISTSAIPAAAPRIAYVYSYGFRVPREDIAPLQQRHIQQLVLGSNTFAK